MGRLETREIKISHAEATSGKWQSVSQKGPDFYANVTFEDDEPTPSSYTTKYRREHNLGEFAGSSSSSSNDGGGKSESKKSSGKSSFSVFGDDNDDEPRREPIPFTSLEMGIVTRSLEEDYDPEPEKHLEKILTHYEMVKGLDAQTDGDRDLKDRKMKEFLNFMVDFPTPTDPATFYNVLMFLDFMANRNKIFADDAVFGGFQLTGKTQNVLKVRMDNLATAKENNPLKTTEIFDVICKTKPGSGKHGTYAFHYGVKYCCQALVEEGKVESLKKILKLYDMELNEAADALEQFPIPDSNKSELKATLKLLTENKRQKSSLKKKISEIAEIVLAKYNDDAELMEFAVKKDLEETKSAAKTYNIVKYTSLVIIVLFGGILMYLPLVVWLIIYMSGLHDKIPALKRGKEAKEKLKLLKK